MSDVREEAAPSAADNDDTRRDAPSASSVPHPQEPVSSTPVTGAAPSDTMRGPAADESDTTSLQKHIEAGPPPEVAAPPPAHVAEHRDGPLDGYFEPVSGDTLLPPRLTAASVSGSLIEPSASNDAAISHLDLNGLSVAHARQARAEDLHRPKPHHTVSSSSTASSMTIRAPHQPATSLSRSRFGPHFPDQSYSALQRQRHPSPRPTQSLRTRSSNPAAYRSYIGGAKLTKVTSGPAPTGSRTAGNSPSSSPGLFTPITSPSRPKSVHEDASGAYSSPFLHFTQRQIPKETHVADIDVDPVSGRKIINQYEIIDELGRGVHGKVKLGRILPEGDYVAIKIVERYSKRKRLGKNTSHEDKIKKEIAILKKARHPNIVSLLEVIDDPQRKKVYIVLEFVELGEIAWRTKGLDEISRIEFRRCLRELKGLENDTEEVAAEERSILEKASKKRRKERRRLWDSRYGEVGSSGADGDSWSFEHQGEDPDDGWDSASRHSDATSGSYRSRQSSTIEEELPTQLLPRPTDELSPPPPTSTDGASSEFATITALSDVVEPAHQRVEPFPNVNDLDTVTATGLEGTMYGSYEDVSAIGRTPSIAESTGSWIPDDPLLTRVPEHFQYVPLMTMSQARNAFRDTVLGLEYLHFQGVIHRDVKPANLLQTKDHRVKISDFGVSYMGRERSATDTDASESEVPDVDEALELAKTVGTPAFYAPELCRTDLDEDEPTPPVTGQIDVWALGVTLYCLIFGRVPFHDHSPFALMAKIANVQVHIPKRRLKAVEERSASRPGSRGRLFQSKHISRRNAQDLEYEDIEDDLRNLLQRLFVKDPRDRITLMEVKHHPWVLQGITDPLHWLEETDPSTQTGTKIQVSREDVQEAVVPLNLIDKITSNLRRGIGNVTGALGLGRSSSTRSRTRSSATNPDNPALPPSAASSSSTISQDMHMTTARADENIFSALRASKEARPGMVKGTTTTASMAHMLDRYDASGYHAPQEPVHGLEKDLGDLIHTRPQPERTISVSSATDSKTIRPGDLGKARFQDLGAGPMTFPAFPSTPKALEPAGASSLGGLLGGAGRRLSRIVGRSHEGSSRESSRAGSQERYRTSKAIDRVHEGSDDPHAEPSLGLSEAVASGMLKQPDLPEPGSRPASGSASPVASPRHSRATSLQSPLAHQSGVESSSRPSSVSSAASVTKRRPHSGSLLSPDLMNVHHAPKDPAREFDRAREESFRRMMFEDHQQHDRPSRPSSVMQRGQSASPACPPSPDDEIFHHRQQDEASSRPRSATAPADPHPVPQHIPHLPPGRFVTPSSSEDQFPSGLSQWTSNPSIPSVVSADSSLSPGYEVEGLSDLRHSGKNYRGSGTDVPSDGSTIHTIATSVGTSTRGGGGGQHEDDEGYVGDHAVESDETDSDSDGGGFLEMTRHKSRGAAGPSESSVASSPAPEQQQSSSSSSSTGRQRPRRAPSNRKSGRTGSNSTMQKVRSHEGRGGAAAADDDNPPAHAAERTS